MLARVQAWFVAANRRDPGAGLDWPDGRGAADALTEMLLRFASSWRFLFGAGASPTQRICTFPHSGHGD